MILNQGVENVQIKKREEHGYVIQLSKDKQYNILVIQKGIDVVVRLLDSNNVLIEEKDSPNGTQGPEQFDYLPRFSGNFNIKIKVLDDPSNTVGAYDIKVIEYTKEQLDFIKKEKEKILTLENDITQQIVERVGHEATHFQQTAIKYNNKCALLNNALVESICDYMAEVVSGKPVVLRKDAYDYINIHEKEIWETFKKEMCSPSPGAWLFNFSDKDKPGNLGFAVGHKIIDAYYQQAKDKSKVYTEIIEMTNPSEFLEKSGYGK